MSDPTNPVRIGNTVPITPEMAKATIPTAAEQAQKLSADETAGAIASTQPLPGPLREAFASDPPSFMGLEVPPVTATHVNFLVRAKSPFFEALLLGASAACIDNPEEKARIIKQAEEMRVTTEDLFLVLLVFSAGPEGVRDIGRAGKDGQYMMVQDLMDHFAPVTDGMLAHFLSQHYFSSFATAIQHQAAETEGKKKIVFHNVNADGLGWLLNLICTLMERFHKTEQEAWDYPLQKGFALLAWSEENHPFCAVDRVTDGYIAQEMERKK